MRAEELDFIHIEQNLVEVQLPTALKILLTETFDDR